MAKDLGQNGLLYLLQSLLGNSTPNMDGSAATGSSARWARQDHTHPSDTSRVPTTRKVAGKALSSDITLSASDVGALPDNTAIPSKTSDLQNDSDFVADSSYVHTDNNYSDTEKSKLSGIAAGAEVNVNADWDASSGDAQILNKPTLGAAAAKDVDSAVTSGSSKLPTSDAVATAIATAVTGSAQYKGVVDAGTDISGLTDYKAGWYWFVGTAGTFVGETCEVGDMIVCNKDKASAYSASDFRVLQTNVVELTNAEIDTIIANANA